MTVLETFISFAQRLPADKRESIESVLSSVMASYSEHHAFNAAELTELDQRVVESHPGFANPHDISELFGKPFSA